MKFITQNQKKAGVLIYPMKPNLTNAVLLSREFLWPALWHVGRQAVHFSHSR